jgi:tetratricopeptide (TPR) repeat protein
MSNRKALLLLICTGLILAGSYLFRLTTERAPFLETVLGMEEPAPPDILSAEEQIAFWTGRLSPGTQDYLTLTQLGRAYLARARETGDAASYARAEESVRRALALNDQYEPATSLLGAVLIGQHDFAGALAAAERAQALNPNSLQSLATGGDASLELGDYAAAETAYRALYERGGGGAAQARLSRLAWLQGRPDEAIQWMERAAREAVVLDLGGESLAWYRAQVGELYFNTGNVRTAARWYREADDALPGYYLARAGLGKVAAARGDLDEAIALYKTLVEQLPQPGFVAYLGDLYALRGDQAAAREQYDTVALIHQIDETQQVLYNRAMALYFANHNIRLDEALAYAEAELTTRQDIYAYDTLGWVLYRLGRYEEARAAADKALALGTTDAMLFYHAGMIDAALGNRPGAEANLRRALDLNPHFDLLQAEAARVALETLTQ